MTRNNPMSRSEQVEQFPSPPNLPPGDTFRGKLMFAARKFADLQVSTVLKNLIPWLQHLNGAVLEVGCGAQPYRHFIPESCIYRGLDWDQASNHFNYSAPDTDTYDGGVFPYEDNRFENLYHTEVLEHIFEKERFLKECKRVIKPGGGMFFDVPFQARYHYIPHDYWRFTPAALKKMLEDAGFESVVIKPRGNDIAVAIYKCVSVVFRWAQSGFMGKIAGALFSPAVFIALIIAHLSIRLNAGSTEDCLGYSVTARA
jgi:SAM-dependent methyltransferase